MVNILPQNGRIAIVDDQIKQAEPLINAFSMHRYPVTYYSGDVRFLPNQEVNDIRLLFLDINLIDDSEHDNKALKARLVPVLNRIISETNYPYIIVYWSRHETHKELIENDIFGNDLKNKKPIAYISANKSDYFSLDGTITEDFNEKFTSLLSTIIVSVRNHASYCYMLQWENLIHFSANDVLLDIFNSCDGSPEWEKKSNMILSNLSKAYLGRHYPDNTLEDKIKASYNAFNQIFNDTIEMNIRKKSLESTIDIDTADDINKEQLSIVSSELNKRINISDYSSSNVEPGVVFEIKDSLEDFERMLDVFNPNLVIKDSDKEADKETKKTKRDDVKSTWKTIGLVVTPSCDYVQKKTNGYHRYVKGILVESRFVGKFDKKTESVCYSPRFSYDGKEYVIAICFIYFTASNLSGLADLIPLFRVRQAPLSEFQSKLSRHINRQGILFLD